MGNPRLRGGSAPFFAGYRQLADTQKYFLFGEQTIPCKFTNGRFVLRKETPREEWSGFCRSPAHVKSSAPVRLMAEVQRSNPVKSSPTPAAPTVIHRT
jgi:hypothetical protein